MTTLQWLTGAGALLLAFFGWRFQRRGQLIQNLESQLELQKGSAEIDLTKHEVQDASDQAKKSSDDYDALKRANDELAKKLGLRGPDAPRN